MVLFGDRAEGPIGRAFGVRLVGCFTEAEIFSLEVSGGPPLGVIDETVEAWVEGIDVGDVCFVGDFQSGEVIRTIHDDTAEAITDKVDGCSGSGAEGVAFGFAVGCGVWMPSASNKPAGPAACSSVVASFSIGM